MNPGLCFLLDPQSIKISDGKSQVHFFYQNNNFTETGVGLLFLSDYTEMVKYCILMCFHKIIQPLFSA